MTDRNRVVVTTSPDKPGIVTPSRGELLLSVMVPDRTTEQIWGLPHSGEAMSMIVETRLGAAQVVADQVAAALRPDDVLASVEAELDQRMKGTPAR